MSKCFLCLCLKKNQNAPHIQRVGCQPEKTTLHGGQSRSSFMYGHTYSKSMDQPGKVANPARGQLNVENEYSPSAFAPDNLVSRDGFGSPVPRQPSACSSRCSR